MRRKWIDRMGCELPVALQCRLAGVNRTTLYYHPTDRQEDAATLAIMRLIDEEYTRHPFLGARKMRLHLNGQGIAISRRRTAKLMGRMGLQAMVPGPNTSKPQPGHKVYPYLLRGMEITRPNQVWSTDITYIRLPRGFVYLVAVIDWYSRKVLSWRLSNTMDTGFCVDCLEGALAQGTPEIFNTDQGSQFTSMEFTGRLEAAGIKISMDGKGRALDNIFVERLWRSVKYEDVYLRGYETLPELLMGLTRYFEYYNEERPHQSLGNATPAATHAGKSVRREVPLPLEI